MATTIPVPTALLKQILAEQSGLCASCGAALTGPKKKRKQIHHIDHSGESKKPNNTKENLIYLCIDCHNLVHLRVALSSRSIRYLKQPTSMEDYFFREACKLWWHSIRGLPYTLKYVVRNLAQKKLDGDVE